MGLSCIKPKKVLKDKFEINPISKKTTDNHVIYNYQETLKTVLDEIFNKYLKHTDKSNLVSRTIFNIPISETEEENIANLIQSLEEVDFFTYYYSIDELERYLNHCSNPNSPQTNITSDEDSFSPEECSISLSNQILFGTINYIKTLTEDELVNVLQNEKIHLQLASKDEYTEKMIAILRKATEFHLIGDIIDLSNEDGNPAISLAVLYRNIKGLYFLVFECQAKIPLYIFEEQGKTPFLIYIAKHGKIYTKKNENDVEYILLHLLKQLINFYPKYDLLEHLKEIDEKTHLSLPHFLVSILRSSTDLRLQIKDCIKLCIQEYPACSTIMCTNYDDPRFKFDVIAILISSPEIDFSMFEEVLRNLKLTSNNEYRNVLRDLIQVHQERDKERLLKIIG